MNKSVYENCVTKCIMISLEKQIPKKFDDYKPDYQNTPLIFITRACRGTHRSRYDNHERRTREREREREALSRLPDEISSKCT